MLRFDTIIGDIPYLLLGIPLTLALTAVAFVAGLLLALPIAIARSAAVPVISPLMRLIVDFFRTTPPLMHIVWAYYALPVIADIRLDAFYGRRRRAGLQFGRADVRDLPRRHRGGSARAVGCRKCDRPLYLQRLWWVILPQSLRLIYAPACNALVSLLKQSSLAAVIALPEVMNRGWVLAAQNFRPIEVLTTIALIYFVLTWPLVLLASYLERRSGLAFQSD